VSAPGTAGPAPAVLFDVDGTLVDSSYLHVHAWHRAFTEADLAVECWRIHRCIGMDGSTLVSTLAGDADDDTREQAKDLHARYYKEMVELLQLLPGARELLHRVDALGLQVVLATSAPEDELAILRKVLDSDGVVSAVTSSDDVDTAKPRPLRPDQLPDQAGAQPLPEPPGRPPADSDQPVEERRIAGQPGDINSPAAGEFGPQGAKCGKPLDDLPGAVQTLSLRLRQHGLCRWIHAGGDLEGPVQARDARIGLDEDAHPSPEQRLRIAFCQQPPDVRPVGQRNRPIVAGNRPVQRGPEQLEFAADRGKNRLAAHPRGIGHRVDRR
jgi:phosphoglycolate phosphatase-like HAD superfamily hydrolase